MKVHISQDAFKRNSKAVFTVPLPDRSPVYMSFDLVEHMNDTWACVIVDSSRFLSLWRNEAYSIHRKEAMGTPESWKQDYKFDRAEEGFGCGKDNPVPLAYVSFGMSTHTEVSYKFLKFGKSISSKEVPSVGFTDGITRTIWLMANHCRCFPIKCSLPGAEELNKYAGASASSVMRISDLINTDFKDTHTEL